MPTQAVWVIWVHSLPFAEQEREIPIAAEVPPKRVGRIDKDCHKPQAEERGFRHAKFQWLRIALHSGQNDDRESSAIFQGVGEVDTTPARRWANLTGLLIRLLHTRILGETLTETDKRGHRDDKRHPEEASAVAVRRTGRAVLGRKKHAQADEEISKHFCVTRQGIGEQDVPEFSILGLCNASDTDSFQSC